MVKMKDALLTSQTPARNSSLLHSSLRLCASPLQLLRPRDKQFSPRDWYDTEKRIEENEYSFKNHVYQKVFLMHCVFLGKCLNSALGKQVVTSVKYSPKLMFYRKFSQT